MTFVVPLAGALSVGAPGGVSVAKVQVPDVPVPAAFLATTFQLYVLEYDPLNDIDVPAVFPTHVVAEPVSQYTSYDATAPPLVGAFQLSVTGTG
jgi:hypothetical protein